MMDSIPYSSAADRNRYPILEQLRLLMPPTARVLEIGSGTGQHAVHMTRELKGLTWQPTDLHDNLAGLEACFAREGNERILPVIELDVLGDHWPDHPYEAAYSANTAHIMSWRAVTAMFHGLSAHLVANARFFLYGPFNINGKFTAESNRQFDARLRAGNPQMGIRDLAEVEKLAHDNGMRLEQRLQMPANNMLLVFRKS